MEPTRDHHDHDEHHAPERASAATYRRRRVVAAAGLALVLAVVVLGLVRLTASGDATDALEPPGSTAVSTGDVGSGGSGAPTSTTTALAVPGFASPQAYLACVKDRESRGDYSAVSPDGQFFGAYQIDQVTWNNTAQHAGMLNVYEIQPNLAAPADQDALAMALLEWQGTSPWAGDC